LALFYGLLEQSQDLLGDWRNTDRRKVPPLLRGIKIRHVTNGHTTGSTQYSQSETEYLLHRPLKKNTALPIRQDFRQGKLDMNGMKELFIDVLQTVMEAELEKKLGHEKSERTSKKANVCRKTTETATRKRW